jgi:putative ABC transport system permease protein
LILVFIPVAGVLIIIHKWTSEGQESLYGIARMLGQLLIVGYFLTYLFKSDDVWVVLAVLSIMVFSASWIALRTTKASRSSFYAKALCAIALGGGINLLIVTQGVLYIDPWYSPRFLIPLAGMIFAGAMNSISIAAERIQTEMNRDVPYTKARGIALKASLIPIVNSLFAVGLVSLPGMMTGQVLSGVSPLIAARYQIMVMCMLFASAGISAACFMTLIKSDLEGDV